MGYKILNSVSPVPELEGPNPHASLNRGAYGTFSPAAVSCTLPVLVSEANLLGCGATGVWTNKGYSGSKLRNQRAEQQMTQATTTTIVLAVTNNNSSITTVPH